MNFNLYPIQNHYMPVNYRLAEEYFNSLPPTDQSRRYYEGEQYRAVKGWLNSYIWNRFTTYPKLNTLSKFYPYQKQIVETQEDLHDTWTSRLRWAGYATAASWVFIFQYAKRGAVLPILREYGHFFKTHRIFRQYAWTLLLPALVANESVFYDFHDHIEVLWCVHANRLNNKDLSDPYGTVYPDKLRAPRKTFFLRNQH